MSIVLILFAVVVGVPLLSYAIYLVENARAGLLPRVRELCGGHLARAVFWAIWNSMWSIGLVILAYNLAGCQGRNIVRPCQVYFPL